MKKTSSRHLRFSPAGLIAIKTIQAMYPSLGRSEAIEHALKQVASNLPATPPTQFRILGTDDLVQLHDFAMSAEKRVKGIRGAILGSKSEIPRQVLGVLDKELADARSFRCRIADLANLSNSLSPAFAIALKQKSEQLEGLRFVKEADQEKIAFDDLLVGLIRVLFDQPQP